MSAAISCSVELLSWNINILLGGGAANNNITKHIAVHAKESLSTASNHENPNHTPTNDITISSRSNSLILTLSPQIQKMKITYIP